MVCTNLCLPYVRVRVSGGHLCEAEAPTEAAAEMVAYIKNSLPCVRGGGSRMADGGVVTYFRLIRKPMYYKLCSAYLIFSL